MTEAAPLKPLDAIAVRITEYLSAGGLFNPEMAKHEAVRDLLMDCRDAIEADRRAPQAELAAMSADELRTRLQACLEVQRETAAHNRRLLGELDGEIAAPQAEPHAEQPPEPFDCALIVRCAKWCGKEKCRDHDAIAHAELVKAARETVRRHNEWAAQMPAGGFDDPLSDAIAALRAALPPEGAA